MGSRKGAPILGLRLGRQFDVAVIEFDEVLDVFAGVLLAELLGLLLNECSE